VLLNRKWYFPGSGNEALICSKVGGYPGPDGFGARKTLGFASVSPSSGIKYLYHPQKRGGSMENINPKHKV
jgi:hypothetical protein